MVWNQFVSWLPLCYYYVCLVVATLIFLRSSWMRDRSDGLIWVDRRPLLLATPTELLVVLLLWTMVFDY